MDNRTEFPTSPSAPRPHAGVPEFAGVCTYATVGTGGYSVEENVRRLKRFNWVETRLADLILSRLASTPEWEVKGGLCLHVWLAAEHARWLQERVAELRHPPHNFHRAPDASLDTWLDEAFHSHTTVELLTALYRCIKPALLDAYREHLAQTHPLVDHPTRRLLRFMIQEEEEMLEWGRAALAELLDTEAARREADAWAAHLDAYGDAAEFRPGRFAAPASPGDREQLAPGLAESRLSEDAPEGEPALTNPKGETGNSALPPPRATRPFEPDWSPRRDARFESHNYHFPPHWIYAQRERPAEERNLALVCKRLLEMDVPEMMAAIVWRARREAEAAGRPRPWGYTADMCRQIWDEARHSMMGQAWLVQRGVDFTRVPLNIGFSLGLNQLATAREAHATLYWIEQGLMPSTTGKAYEWRTACDSGDPLSRLFMDYDWADEVLHVHIGQRWLVREVGGRDEAERLGRDAFARVMAVRRRRGLEGAVETAQHEWWPEFCQDVLGFRPEPLGPEVYESADDDAPWLKNG